eukprot:m.12829 g.12829  ORF g.12829 m.12829 type:complete len:876 (+) comp7904_c0_seq1:52-2679(+)
MAAQLELERLRAEVTEKDLLLETMQKTLKANADTVDELMCEAKELAARTEMEYSAQLEIKTKELDTVRALMMEMQDTQSASPAPRSPRFTRAQEKKTDRSFMDDYLISVLEQKDKLADELHARTNSYAEIKAKLGMAEFENERLLAEYRAQTRLNTRSNSSDGILGEGAGGLVVERNSDGGGADSGVDEMGETLDTVRAERDKLATSLAEMNRTMQQLRDRMGGDERSVRESERRRRKDAHKANVSIRTKTQLDELDKENKRLVAEVKRCEEAEEQVRELKEQIASKESMLRDRDAAVIAAEEEMSLLRSLIGSASSDRTSAIELEAKITAAEKVTARVEGERDAAAAGHTREREANEAKVAALTSEIGTVRRSAGDASLLGEKLATAIAATARAEAACEAATLAAAKEREALEAKHAKVTADLEAARLAATEAAAAHIVELDALKDTSSNAKALLAAAEVETAKAALLRSQVDSVRSDAEAEVTRIHNLFLKEQERRKGVQNLLMEFVGNIRVFSRVRPTSGESPALVRATSKLVVQARFTENKRDFEFDRAFAAGETADEVFSEVKPLVSSFLDGFNTCVLAYGQTGSGKTHTMFGPPAESGLPEMSGIIPRVIAEVFELKEAQRAMATVSIEITVLEVYNEAVRDLLSEKPWAKHEVTDSGSGAEVLTAEKVAVDCEADVSRLVANGLANRVERKTDLNDHSSRSHLIVTVHGTRQSLMYDGMTTSAKMHLVDLAGSENAKLAGSVGDGLTEGKNINKSLSALSGVMQALALQKGGGAAQHVPYRNSRLTYLLKDAIGGDAKTVMFVCVRPEEPFSAESMQTLRFGAKARCIAKGPAQRNVIQKLAGDAALAAKGTSSAKATRSPKTKKKTK